VRIFGPLALAACIIAVAMHASASQTAGSQNITFQVVPYSTQTQLGYHIINITTYGTDTVAIGDNEFTFKQNFITPNESGLTVNNHSYTLYVGQPIQLIDVNNSYALLVQVNYIPIEHTVDYNIYENNTPPSTTTTSTSSTTSTSTSILPPVPTTTLNYTTTTNSSVNPGGPCVGVDGQPCSANPIVNFIDEIIAFFRGLFK